MPHRGFQACAGRAVLEGVETELVQQRSQGDARVVRHRIAQGQRAVGRQFTHEPLGQRPDGVVAAVVVIIGRAGANGDDGALHVGSGRYCPAGLMGLPFHRPFAAGLHRRLILRPDKASIDCKLSVGVDADKRAGARDLGRLIANGPVLEGRKRCLDLAEPGVDLVRQLVGTFVFAFELGVLSGQRIEDHLLLWRELECHTLELPKMARVAIAEIDGHLDPLPAFGGDRLGLRCQLLGRQPVEQGDVLEPATIVFLEQIPQDHASG